MAFLCSFILTTRMKEINSQPFFFHRKEFLSWKKPFKDLSLDMYALYKMKKKNYLEYRIEVQQNEEFIKSSWRKNFFSIFKLSIKFISCALKLRLWQNI